MKTIQIEIALMRFLDFRQNIVVPNVSWGMRFAEGGALHECDILALSKSGYATEIEIKISKSDLKKDAKKPHSHRHRAIKRLFFAVPEHLREFAMTHIPERAGLLVVTGMNGFNVKQVKPPVVDANALQWSPEKRLKLASLGAMRICGLKEKVFKLSQTS